MPKSTLPSPKPKAIYFEGVHGGLYPVDMGKQGLDPDSLRKMGGAASKGAVQTLQEQDCVVAFINQRLAALLDPSQEVCHRCRRNLEDVSHQLMALVDGSAVSSAVADLQAYCEPWRHVSHCPSLREAANLILSGLEHFPVEFRLHAENKNCPARVCSKLLPAPCHQTCPADIDIPSFLALIAAGRHQEAWEVMREDNPFPWVCGLVCPHPCERVCVRANLDDAINIRFLKAFASEWVAKHGDLRPPEPAPPTGRLVAVVGSGPAGLSCAYFLALKGHRVTVFEAHEQPGGLLLEAIPDYRLPREVVGKEIGLLRALGVDLKTGVTVGRDVSLDELRSQGYEAFFLGIGAHLGYKLKIEGETDFPQVYDVISFLRNIYLGSKVKPADKVVIIGGGNAAIDAARTCLRLGCEEVHVSYRRTRAEMTAHPEEVEQALEEGVNIHFLTVPIKIGGNGQVEYLECLQAELGQPDASGRRRPIPIPDSNFRLQAGAVITAIGQQPDFCPFPEPPVATTPWCTIVTEEKSTRTGVKNIFAGGDAVTGPATVVEAIAAGKQAALEIHHYLNGESGPAPRVHFQKRRKVPFQAIPAADKLGRHRNPAPLVPPAQRRQNFEPVELSFTEEQAQLEASRCLRCDVCIRCGACERTCREEMGVDALHFAEISDTERILHDYQRPQERCITCGACALACPTQAIDYLEEEGFREVRLCGTVLNRLESPRCQGCGAPFVPSRYLSYITGRSDQTMNKHVLRRLCPACARQQRAEKMVTIW